MTEAQFKWLCNNCDQILMAEEATHSTIAISWLHVIRPHPQIYIKYKELFINDNSLRRNLSLILNKFLLKTRQIFQILLIIQESIYLLFEKTFTDNHIDILIISHRLSYSKIKNDDLYYGELPLNLVQDGYRVLIAYIDQAPGIKIEKRDWTHRSGIRHLILPKALSIKSEILLKRNLETEKLRILDLAKKNISNTESFNFLNNLSRQALSTDSKSAYRIGLQVGELVKKFQPKIILTTYEGHAWERLVFSESKKANPQIKCLGYQHAPIFNMQHANCRNLKSRYNPDYILASGVVSCEKFKNNISLKNILMRIVGSKRAEDNNIIENKILKYKDINDIVFIVCPEGFISECNLMIEFVVKSAKINPEIKFIIRLHPGIKKGSLNNNRLPKNVIFSDSQISSDLQKSTHILYRGSSAVFQAVSCGIQPVYLSLDGEIDINPLFEVSEYMLKVSKPNDLNNAINSHIYRKDINFMKINEYCKNSYTPFIYKNFLKVLSECNL